MTKNHVFCRIQYLSSTDVLGLQLDYFSMIRSREMKMWYPLILVCIPTKSGGCMPSDHVITSCDMYEW